MQDLNHDFKTLCRRNRDGSFATQSDREHILTLVANQLQEGGFRHLRLQGLKPKHVAYLVVRWHAERIGIGTFKNRMVALRWTAEKIGKHNIVARSNADYAIGRRTHVTNTSKATELLDEQLAEVSDACTAVSLRLAEAFGLRCEEAIKLRPRIADRGTVLHLQASWTKGGRERDVPILTEAQRELLEEAKALATGGSLIPPHMSYRQQRLRFESQCQAAGIRRVHGLRHRYAQRRYRELTGWDAPACGGPRSRALTPEQRALDLKSRLQISSELGHARESITAVYLGR